jgi:hypothetical protein
MSAWQFREYTNNPSAWRYKVGNNVIQFNPNTACGSSVVNITDQATADLYNYTPYQPNAAALANLNGIGDSCSSYGNRNFWVIWSNWFGSPTGVNPFGSFDALTASVSSTSASLTVSGWDIDATAPTTSIFADVYVTNPAGKQTGYRLTANTSRPDVGSAYPGTGSNHGFSGTVPITTPGTYQVCVFAIAVAGNSTLLQCRAVTVPGGTPYGSFDAASIVASSSSASLAVSGWDIDPSMPTTSIPADVYITNPAGKQTGYRLTANTTRADVAAAHPGTGTAHGFSGTFPITTPGTYQVCVFAIGSSVFTIGTNTLIQCKSVNATDSPPYGAFDGASVVTSGSSSAINVSGWDIDPTIPTTSIPADIYITAPNGTQTGYRLTANTTRADVAAAFPGTGTTHGFSSSFPITQNGTYQVCAFAIGFSPLSIGHNTLLRCISVTKP